MLQVITFPWQALINVHRTHQRKLLSGGCSSPEFFWNVCVKIKQFDEFWDPGGETFNGDTVCVQDLLATLLLTIMMAG